MLTGVHTHYGSPCLTTDTISQTVLFPNLFDKPLLARSDQSHTRSDGGAVLPRATEKVYGLMAGFVRCVDSADREPESRRRARSTAASPAPGLGAHRGSVAP